MERGEELSLPLDCNHWAALFSLHNVLAEVETRTDRKPCRPSAIFQEIVEQMVVHEIALHSEGDMF